MYNGLEKCRKEDLNLPRLVHVWPHQLKAPLARFPSPRRFRSTLKTRQKRGNLDYYYSSQQKTKKIVEYAYEHDFRRSQFRDFLTLVYCCDMKISGFFCKAQSRFSDSNLSIHTFADCIVVGKNCVNGIPNKFGNIFF